MEEKLVSYTFEIPEKMKAQLDRIADEEHRSLAGQIRLVLEEYVDKEAGKKWKS